MQGREKWTPVPSKPKRVFTTLRKRDPCASSQVPRHFHIVHGDDGLLFCR
jgi:hypothetical protein